MRRAGMLGALAAGLAMTIGPALATDHHRGRTRYPTGHARNGRGHGTPHQGEREIARRLRQQARDAKRQEARLWIRHPRVLAEQIAPRAPVTGISRRFRWVYADGG